MPGLRCPAWTGSVTVTSNISGSDPLFPGSDQIVTATAGFDMRCQLKGDDGPASCMATVRGTTKSKRTSSTTSGSGQFETRIDASQERGVTRIKIGTFKLKRTTKFSDADLGSHTAESEDEDGGWEFEGPASRGDHQVGTWTDPRGYMNATWDLALE